MKILPNPRERLMQLADAKGESLAALSRMIRRRPGYLWAFVHEGYPEQLAPADRQLIADHYGVSEVELGADDPRWAKWKRAA